MVRLHSVIPLYFPAHSCQQASIYNSLNYYNIYFFSVCSKCYYSISVRLTAILKTQSVTFQKRPNHAYNPNGPRTACNLLWLCLFRHFRQTIQESKRVKIPSLNRALLENYRPVSLLPFIAKTLE